MSKVYTAHRFLPPNFVDHRQKLFDGLNELAGCPTPFLRDTDYIQDLIERVGLCSHPWTNTYGDAEKFTNWDGMGIWQMPEQFAPALVQLSQYEIKKIVEIGNGRGWTLAFLVQYLRRFNGDIEVHTCDPHLQWVEIEEVEEKYFPVNFYEVVSSQMPPQDTDLCIIDAVHEWNHVENDFLRHGQRAKYVFWHDIIESSCPGSVQWWNDFKNGIAAMGKGRNYELTEYIAHRSGLPTMGVGIGVKKC